MFLLGFNPAATSPRNFHRRPRRLPIHPQDAPVAHPVQRDREISPPPREATTPSYPRARDHAPSPGYGIPQNGPPLCILRFLADDQSPLTLFGNREERVVPRGHRLAANRYVRVGHKRRRLVRACPPNLPVRHEAAKNFAPLRAWARIVHDDCLAVGGIEIPRVPRG